MGNKWKHAGTGEGIVGLTLQMIGLGGKETVRNTETGEFRTVFVRPGETVGQAIENGNFVDDD